MSFAEAVRTSLQDPDGDPSVVFLVQNDGQIFTAGRATTLDEIAMLSSLPEFPVLTPVLIKADRRAKHTDIRAVMDACAKAGFFKIRFKMLKDELQNKEIHRTQ